MTSGTRGETEPGEPSLAAVPPHADDLRLVRAARLGDERALATLVERLACVRQFLAARNQRLGAPIEREELADLVQEVVMAVWVRLDDYGGWAALETWVYPFCVHKLQNALAKRRRRGDVLTTEEGEVLEAAPEPTRESPVDVERLNAALDRLGPPKSEVVRLRHFEGLEFDAIARRFQVPLETAKTWYYRGLKSLRAMLGEAGGVA